MNTPAFLNEIKQECLLFHIDENNKKIFDRRCFGKNYTVEQVEAIKQPNQQIGIMYDIKETNYVVVDIDTNDYTTEDLFNDSDIDSCYVKGNTKGFHVWTQMKNKTDEYKKNKVDCGLNSTIDFLGEKVFECIGKKWVHDDACYLDDINIEKTFKPGTFQKRIISQTSNSQPINKKLLERLVALIDIKYCDNRESWIKIILAIKKCGLSFKVADDWSKRSLGYTSNGMETAWNSYTSDELITVGEGTIRYYAKSSNSAEYVKLCPPKNAESFFIKIEQLTKGALTVAEVISLKLEKHLKWSNEKWFMFYKKTNLWVETKEPSHLIVQIIHQHIDYSIKIKINERIECEDDERRSLITKDIEAYAKMYGNIDKPGFYSMITKHLKTILYDSEFYLKLDNNPYEIVFLNGIYDMKQGDFSIGYGDENYITKTIPFDYQLPTEEETEFVSNIIFKICNCNEAHMSYYLGVLGQAMLGDAELEKALYFCVGVGGNNGKTLILEALADIMPNYVGKIERKTFEKGYSKAHKHLAGTKGKRIVYVEELSQKEQEIELLKEIADGKNIKNEIMFGTDELINIMFKLIFLSNNQANLRVDGGIENRYRQLSHYSKFNKETAVDNYEALDFVQDKTLAGLLKSNYKYALIKLILDAGHNYTKTNKLVIPTEFEEAATDALEANDEVKIWFNETCEYGAEFKCSKKELEMAISKPFREIQTEIQRITNFKYSKDLKFGKSCRGGFKGFRIVPLEDDGAGCQIDM